MLGKLEGDIWAVTSDPEGKLRDTYKAEDVADRATVLKCQQNKDNYWLIGESTNTNMGKMLKETLEYFLVQV